MAMPGCSGARLCAALLFVSVNVGLLGLYATRPVTHYTMVGDYVSGSPRQYEGGLLDAPAAR